MTIASVIYGLLMLVGMGLLLVPPAFLYIRRRNPHRKPVHCCAKCGYDLAGLPTNNACPESHARERGTPVRRAGPLVLTIAIGLPLLAAATNSVVLAMHGSEPMGLGNFLFSALIGGSALACFSLVVLMTIPRATSRELLLCSFGGTASISLIVAWTYTTQSQDPLWAIAMPFTLPIGGYGYALGLWIGAIVGK